MIRVKHIISMKALNLTVILGAALTLINSGCVSIGSVKSEALTTYENGMNLYEKKLYKDAVTHFQKVINDFPDNPIAQVCYYYLGESLKEIGDTAQAVKTFESLVEKYKNGYWANSARKQLRTLKSSD